MTKMGGQELNEKMIVFVILLSILSLGYTLPTFCNQRSFGGNSFVCVCNASYCDYPEGVYKRGKTVYAQYQSAAQGGRLTQIIYYFEEMAAIQSNVIKIDKNVTYQKIFGFGGAMTDAAGINIASLSNQTGDNLLKAYFSKDGIEYNIARIPMASCDFSTHPYSYNDNNDSPPDYNQTKFSLAKEDLKYKVPYLKRAQELSNRTLLIFGSPWSAPAWMKTNNNMTGQGTLKGQPGGSYYKSWAQYFVKFLDAYREQGLKLWGLTAQNEPTDGNIANFTFQAMGWTPQQQRDFIKLDLGPALHQGGYKDVKLMVLDDQRLLLPYWADIVLSDPGARQYISGVAVHWYLDALAPVGSLDLTHKNNPDFFIFGTEACAEHIPLLPIPPVLLGDWARAQRYAHDIIQDLNHWVTGWTDWNIALDMKGGPNWVKNFVDSPVIVNAAKDEFYKQPMFYAMAHFSKFIPEGSVRIEASCGSLECVAVQRPDNGIVVIVLNRDYKETMMTIAAEDNGYINQKIPPFSIQTYLYWSE
ncbi:lysosomal acid glucosylceramidase-like [Mytilus galloprovincialis]|uniref:lysosomal acid glucosylceramidase-like n=1 Tax=Mytilus galloprovincialis TaxID=29158 RepID=UPI003F7BBDF8